MGGDGSGEVRNFSVFSSSDARVLTSGPIFLQRPNSLGVHQHVRLRALNMHERIRIRIRVDIHPLASSPALRE